MCVCMCMYICIYILHNLKKCVDDNDRWEFFVSLHGDHGGDGVVFVTLKGGVVNCITKSQEFKEKCTEYPGSVDK